MNCARKKLDDMKEGSEKQADKWNELSKSKIQGRVRRKDKINR